MSQVVRMLVGNVKTFANPRFINTTRHFASARKKKHAFFYLQYIKFMMGYDKMWLHDNNNRVC